METILILIGLILFVGACIWFTFFLGKIYWQSLVALSEQHQTDTFFYAYLMFVFLGCYLFLQPSDKKR
jgi:hypothetical protein